MPRTWNDDRLRMEFDRIKEDAKRDGFTNEELERPYLDKLSHQTKSYRIYRMIKLAYRLGWMRGIDHVDQGKTPISITTPIETIPTHGDLIRASSDEDLAREAVFGKLGMKGLLRRCPPGSDDACPAGIEMTDKKCLEHWIGWLNQPATGGEAE